ncbi:hypothetical protein A3J78_00015 [Candidatus Beckwithbacteria bacterium RBG_13_35_6]|uniref:Phosphoenolpyruvate synthase n=1 Tax=Candidatus Beckwithbacteria bacterium RBG_13_35_6 TaxID=1797456 RepID=A0A1F5DCD3_9BACT|nr:MAG: hypothetical protein A3J78_00015 [Candidatus Beckwithbacteria bacterium RBG_13_35_6]
MNDIIFYQKINKNHKDQVGNKAFNIHKLDKHGVGIGKFIVLTTHFFDNILETKELRILKAELNSCNTGSLDKHKTDISQQFKNIRIYINQRDFTKDIQQKLAKAVVKLKANKYAVRSSANFEDGVNCSFAGLFDTFLGVSKDNLMDAIKRCYASIFSLQVLTYCLYNKLDFSQIKMAVIIQKMVEAEKGGVIFTSNIFNHKENQIVIEAAKGLGEKVVSGLVNPQRLIFNKATGRCINGQIGMQKQVLNFNEAFKLFKLALKIEKLFSSPQDIEWAIEKGKIYVLQSRQIT